LAHAMCSKLTDEYCQFSVFTGSAWLAAMLFYDNVCVSSLMVEFKVSILFKGGHFMYVANLAAASFGLLHSRLI